MESVREMPNAAAAPVYSLDTSRDTSRDIFRDAFCDILVPNVNGSWEVSLPPDLQSYQGELESLLSKVFSDCSRVPENFALAQQMSLNWYMSKCQEVGISFEDSLRSR